LGDGGGVETRHSQERDEHETDGDGTEAIHKQGVFSIGQWPERSVERQFQKDGDPDG
jgi:hypothetical protein